MPNTKRGRTAGQALASLVRLIPVVALLCSLFTIVGTVSAADPTVTTNPPQVPFAEAPGLPGATQLTFTANGTAGLTACGQDNGVLPTFRLGPVDPNTPLVVNFPFIQAGVYTFWVSADSTCAVGSKLLAGGVPVQATATRRGPSGKAGQDDIAFRFTGASTNAPGSTNGQELILDGAAISKPPKAQVFPLPDARVCIMSGDGAQVTVKMQVGQDARPQGLGAAAVTTTVIPFAGQNGCFAIPWVVNGAYVATIARSGVSNSLGFCDASLATVNAPSNPPTAAGIGKCAQVAFFPDPNNGPFPTGTTINGSIVTGADNHAVQVCASAFSPGPTNGGPAVQQLANQVNAYNGSGAVNLTPLTIPAAFPTKTVLKLTTYDITGTGPGGAGGVQFVCPPATAIQSGTAITAIIVPDVPNATIIDTKNYFIA